MQQDFFYETERLLSKAGVCVIVEHHLIRSAKKYDQSCMSFQDYLRTTRFPMVVIMMPI
jgi:hypothetical protein